MKKYLVVMIEYLMLLMAILIILLIYMPLAFGSLIGRYLEIKEG